jgi:hypothetical protein
MITTMDRGRGQGQHINIIKSNITIHAGMEYRNVVPPVAPAPCKS